MTMLNAAEDIGHQEFSHTAGQGIYIYIYI